MLVFKNVKKPMPVRCLWCNGMLEDGHDLWDIFTRKLWICGKCEAKLIVQHRHFKIDGVRTESLYLYNDFFRSLLIQYKECCDEALYPIFLARYHRYIHHRYHDYVLVPMPSSIAKKQERGFDHLHLMFEACGLPFCDCLYKLDNIQQKGLSAKQRKHLQLGLKDMKIPRKLLLVDDVCSTKATLKAAVQLLANQDRCLRIVVVAYNPSKHKKSLFDKGIDL